MAPALAVDADLTRTCEHGQVHFRQDGSVLSRRIDDAMPLLRRLDRSAFRGTVVYLHGCDGINSLGIKTADMLATAGYLVFVPDGFARHAKPPSCDPQQFEARPLVLEFLDAAGSRR